MSVELLDFTDRDIFLHCDSEPERTMRIRSVDKEPETIEFLRSLPSGSVVFDIGANVGAYSFVAAALGHTVHAFEPAEPNVERLRANQELNPDLHITVHDLFLSDRNGKTTFAYSSTEPGAASHNQDTVVSTEDMDRYTLDTVVDLLGLPAPDALKVDVDGSELDVLCGAMQTLAGVRACIIERPKGSAFTCDVVDQVLASRKLRRVSTHPHEWSDIENVVYRRTR